MAPRPPAELEQQAARYAGVRALATQQLASLWPRVDWASDLAPQAVTALYRAVVARFGSTTATLAADYYDYQRAKQGLRLRYRATVTAPVDDAQIRRIVDSAFLGTDEPLDVHQRRRVRVVTSELPVQERVPQRLEQSVSRLVMQPARDTVAHNVARDPAKPTWIRIPTGETTCEFCIMLASRELGPHFRGYASRERALFDGNGVRFHKGCDCVACQVFPGDDVHALSPNMRDYFAIYKQGADNAGTRTDFKAVLAEMRKVLKTQDPPPAATPDRHDDRRLEIKDLDTPRSRTGDNRPPAAEPPAPPTPPRPPTVAAAGDPGEPEGWSGHTKGYVHPRGTPVWTEQERVQRQHALGVVPEGEQLYQHEVEGVERLLEAGQSLQWLPRDTVNMLPTNDFQWLNRDGIPAELKSAKAKYSTIKNAIAPVVERATEKQVVKNVFVVDLGPKSLTPKLASQLSKYNQRNPTNSIAELWVLADGGLTQVDLL